MESRPHEFSDKWVFCSKKGNVCLTIWPRWTFDHFPSKLRSQVNRGSHVTRPEPALHCTLPKCQGLEYFPRFSVVNVTFKMTKLRQNRACIWKTITIQTISRTGSPENIRGFQASYGIRVFMIKNTLSNLKYSINFWRWIFLPSVLFLMPPSQTYQRIDSGQGTWPNLS